MASPLLPPVKMPQPSLGSSAGPITSSKKLAGSTLHVASGARWIIAQKTGHFSSDISRLQTKISDDSTRRALPGIMAQHIMSKPRSPYSQLPKPPLLPANWPKREPWPKYLSHQDPLLRRLQTYQPSPPRHQANSHVATAGPMVTPPTVVTLAQHATTQETVTRQMQPPRTQWAATPTILSLDFNDVSTAAHADKLIT
jgi:hypothetical protein